MQIMNSYVSDVLIIGAGLVGAAQALALAHYGVRSVVVDKTPLDAVRAQGHDGRVSAISHASVQVLEHIDLWHKVEQEAGAIGSILVTEGGDFSDIHFDAAHVSDDPFGYMVANRSLRIALLEAVEEHPLITFIAEQTVADMVRDGGKVRATLTQGAIIEANLLIVADGRYSQVRDSLGIKARKFDYDQHAMVCTIAHNVHHQERAIEWFLPAGPLALLPMHGGHHSCIVWTERSRFAQHMIALDDATFTYELSRKLCGMLGTIEMVGGKYAYPLNLFQAERYTSERAVLIGDAAHAIHPIAGQGVNLGYRDVAVLTELLVDAMRLGQDIGNASIMQHYQQWRHFDATSMIAMTDGLNRIFSSDSKLVRPVRRLGMGLLNRIEPVKMFFMESAMGMTGDLPHMLRGERI
ncbi:MAG: 2-octaprenyl-6-methoxyphenyl hydroxylase [Alphaproteobacteria bacterium]|nr:MAG: 2-octaprenyl-6-methoxyphenyl hydroxylase [Alphaproteobacteria bacterium]